MPANSVRERIKELEQLKDLDNYVPLYQRFKKYFGYLNLGHVGKHYELFAYNGGLFLPYGVLDNITIDDTILYEGAKKLSDYDFNINVDVNIPRAHIWTQPYRIEELQAKLQGTVVEIQTMKRKKDGAFYTPR